MELAGLEPATSWVRSKVAVALSSAYFQGPAASAVADRGELLGQAAAEGRHECE